MSMLPTFSLPRSRDATLRVLWAGVWIVGLGASVLAAGMDLSSGLRGIQQWLATQVPLDRAPWVVATILMTYLAVSVLAIPVSLLIALSAMLFGVLPGMLVSLAGCLAGAMLGYALGRRFSLTTPGTRNRPLCWLHARLRQRGLPAMVLLRLFPLLPFTAVNLTAGAMQVPWRDYALGTLLGMLPTVIGVSVLFSGLRAANSAESALSVGVAAAALAGVAFAAALFSPFLRRQPVSPAEGACRARASVRAFCATLSEEKSHA